MAARIPILTYHSIDRSESVVSCAPEDFRRQMGSLHDRGYRTMRLADCVECIESKTPFPERRFVITFDDAYRNVYEGAIPVLDELGFSAVIFAISDYVGGYNDWPGHDMPFGRAPLMDASMLRELHEHGFEIGSHTATHPDLATLDERDIEEEIRTGADRLQDLLGKKVDSFAYPYGSLNSMVLSAARMHTRCACTTRLGRVRGASDPHLLPRVDAYYLRGNGSVLDAPAPLLDAGLGFWQLLRAFRSTFK